MASAKKVAAPAPKVTKAMIDAAKEKEKAAQAKEAAAAAAAKSKLVDQIDLEENTNRSRAEAARAGHVDASGIDDAVAGLSLAASGGAAAAEDKHPEKRRKALHMAFEERAMKELRSEFPSLKHSQLKERAWEMWLKSPENPENAAAAF